MQWYGLITTLLLAFTIWDNWQVRGESEQIRDAMAALAVARGATPSSISTPIAGGDCTAIEVSPAPVVPKATAANNVIRVPKQDTEAAQIPPGMDLVKALKYIQREQSKPQLGPTGANPFGTSP